MTRPTPGSLIHRLILFLAALALLAAAAATAAAMEGPVEDAARPQSAPVAPWISIVRSESNPNHVELTWEHAVENTGYQVWRGTTPYFIPASGQGNQIRYVSAAACGQPCYFSRTDDGVDYFFSNPTDPQLPTVQIIGVPAVNYFWVVRGQNGDGASGNSNRVGEFDFALVPGS